MKPEDYRTNCLMGRIRRLLALVPSPDRSAAVQYTAWQLSPATFALPDNAGYAEVSRMKLERQMRKFGRLAA